MSTVASPETSSDSSPFTADGPGPGWQRTLRRNGWTIAVWVLTVLMVLWYASLLPSFGGFAMASIAKSGLPIVFLALAQGVVVIAGGVDLSVGAMLVLANATSARLMEGQPTLVTLAIALGVLAAAALLDALVGWVIETSKVPDIVVTLATSFVFYGLALWIMPSPGGGTSVGLRYLFTGAELGIGSNFWPSLAVVAVVVCIVTWAMRRTRTGLGLYALGSDRQAAFLSGVDVRRAKITAYAIAGALAAIAGVATTAITGAGEARAALGDIATLNSVAAVVLGGITLGGGSGSLVGAAAAGYILALLSPVLTSLGVDPNTAQVVQGVLLIIVVLGAGLIATRRRSR